MEMDVQEIKAGHATGLFQDPRQKGGLSLGGMSVELE